MSATVDISLNGDLLSDVCPEALVLDVMRPLVGDRRHDRISIPGRPGTITFDEEPGDRVLEIEIDIEAASFEDRRAAVRNLAYWAEIGSAARLIIDDEPDRYHEALLDNAPDVMERLCYGSAKLRFAVGPYALALASSTESETANSNPDSDSFAISDVINAEPIIELTANAGTLTSFILTVNGAIITWAGLVTAGNKITISSISDTVTQGGNDDTDLTGYFDESTVDMQDVDTTGFPLLLVGVNDWSLSWTGTATSVTLLFTWRERFR